ncbi:MAG: segregation/condensation protein A [Deltaproteobacteria bacterium]|nr:segregation/condensation protein A [Deltaproteobacteria bacterium]
MAVHVQLQIYEGPLDLLLHLIKQNELSIADIPIASITEQYLEALELMQGLNLDVSGEYLVMAATLLHIKSKTLLPPDEEDEDDDDEPGDTREELIRRLLEYERFKNAARELEDRDILNRDVFVRRDRSERVTDVSFEQLSVFDLMSALQRVLERYPGPSVHRVVQETVSVRERMTYILDELHHRPSVLFQELFDSARSRMDVVVTFLALLELIRMRAVHAVQKDRLGPIVLEPMLSLSEASAAIETDVPEDDYGE